MVPEIFLVSRNLGLEKIWFAKKLGPQKNLSLKNFVDTNVLEAKFFGIQIFWDPKSFGAQIFCDPDFFLTQNYFLDQNSGLVKKIFVSKIF